MINSDLKTARILVNKQLNEITEKWAQDPIGKRYLLRHGETCSDDIIKIQPTYSDTFYALDSFIDIARACGCSYYITVQENHDGILAPTLAIVQ